MIVGYMLDKSLRHVLLIGGDGIRGDIRPGESICEATTRALWDLTGLSMYPETWGVYDTDKAHWYLTCPPQPPGRLRSALAGEVVEIDSLTGDLRLRVERARQACSRLRSS